MVDVVTEANTKKRNIEALRILNEQTGRNIPQSDIFNLLHQYNFTGSRDYWDMHRISKRFHAIRKELGNQKHEGRKKKLLEQGFTTCKRCGGSGKYSWNPKTLDQCFGCGGSGVVPIKKKEGKGWHEPADHTGKAPEHVAAATRTAMQMILNQPMQKANAVIFSGEMWHGTNEENAEKILSSNEFKPSQYSSEDLDIPPDFGVGSYFDLNYETVSQYGDTVLKARTTRPLILFEAKSGSDKGFVQQNWEQLSQTGYDGAICRSGNGENEIVVFNPKGLIVPLYDVGQTDRDDAYSLKYSITEYTNQESDNVNHPHLKMWACPVRDMGNKLTRRHK